MHVSGPMIVRKSFLNKSYSVNVSTNVCVNVSANVSTKIKIENTSSSSVLVFNGTKMFSVEFLNVGAEREFEWDY